MAAYEEPIATRGGKITLETCVNEPSNTFGGSAFAKPTIPTGNTFNTGTATTTTGMGMGAFGGGFGGGIGGGFGGTTSAFNRPTMSSFSTGAYNTGFGGVNTLGTTNAQLEPPSLMDDLLTRLQRFIETDSDAFARTVNPEASSVKFRQGAGTTRFFASSTVIPSPETFAKAPEVILRFCNDHGSVEFLEPLIVADLPNNLDEICKIEPGSVHISVPTHAICSIKNVEADGSTEAERESYMQDLSRQCGVEFVRYFEDDGVWVFRK